MDKTSPGTLSASLKELIKERNKLLGEMFADLFSNNPTLLAQKASEVIDPRVDIKPEKAS